MQYLTTQPRLALSSQSFCLSPPCARIVGVHHHMQLSYGAVCCVLVTFHSCDNISRKINMKREALFWLTVPGLSLCGQLALLVQASPESNFMAEMVMR